MTEEQVFNAISEVITEKLEIPKDKITSNSRFKEDLGADSLDVYELVYSIEEKLGITIPDDQSPDLLTVQDAVTFIMNLKK